MREIIEKSRGTIANGQKEKEKAKVAVLNLASDARRAEMTLLKAQVRLYFSTYI